MDYPNHATPLTDDAVDQPGATAVAAAHDAVRRALSQYGGLTADASSVAPDADLYALGLTSHATVNVMLAIETELDVEFPDELLTRSTFETVGALVAAATAADR